MRGVVLRAVPQPQDRKDNAQSDKNEQNGNGRTTGHGAGHESGHESGHGRTRPSGKRIGRSAPGYEISDVTTEENTDPVRKNAAIRPDPPSNRDS
ncbi:hypothetical protein AA21291_1087 [Swaminathania salitolerans LMG 21291]|uniref:Uncharacterized protein n=1 Tax=Swaminathania salitolerans TaxID=182838 RepID=A0A511BQX4_9PROT|nr:hypothetical protein AA21291_1087 [Swaminathania salitolerans LMG 21291]GEL02746.1 hypothetical protein SSA02_19090 [Swaminathania salitolerans]